MTRRGAIIAGTSSAMWALAAAHSAFAQATCKVNGRVVSCEELGRQVKGFLGLGLGLMALAGLIGLAATVFWIMMLIHASTHQIENRAMWIILMVFTGIVGAAVYYFVVKRAMGAQPAPTAPQTPAPPMTPPAAS